MVRKYLQNIFNITTLFKIIPKNILFFLTITLIIFCLTLPFSLLSQSNGNSVLFVPTEEQPKTLFDLIFNITDIKGGTKIAQKERKEVLKDRGYGKKVNDDSTVAKDNRISKIFTMPSGDRFKVYLELLDYDSRIHLSVYNLLGKIVLDVYDGTPYGSDTPYDINASNLPNGVYLLSVVGKNFRLSNKLIVSR